MKKNGIWTIMRPRIILMETLIQALKFWVGSHALYLFSNFTHRALSVVWPIPFMGGIEVEIISTVGITIFSF